MRIFDAAFESVQNDSSESHQPLFVRDPDASVFFCCNENEYLELTSDDVQRILSTRCIVVTGTSGRTYEFGLDVLDTLGDIEEETDVQGQKTTIQRHRH
jgi:hypothetical protein